LDFCLLTTRWDDPKESEAGRFASDIVAYCIEKPLILSSTIECFPWLTLHGLGTLFISRMLFTIHYFGSWKVLGWLPPCRRSIIVGSLRWEPTKNDRFYGVLCTPYFVGFYSIKYGSALVSTIGSLISLRVVQKAAESSPWHRTRQRE
jgi:hypothetical protein